MNCATKLITSKMHTILCMGVFFLSPYCWAENLFHEMAYRSLIADRRAYQLNDSLTIIVLENANAQANADLTSNKDMHTDLAANYNNNPYSLSLALNGKGAMTGKTGRNGSIKATITGRITKLLADNRYEIYGQQIIRINGEQQTLIVQGIVRAEDISAENTVLSSRLANAEIHYLGKGIIANAQRFNPVFNILSFIGLL